MMFYYVLQSGSVWPSLWLSQASFDVGEIPREEIGSKLRQVSEYGIPLTGMERAQYLQERSIPELKDFLEKGIFSKVHGMQRK